MEEIPLASTSESEDLIRRFKNLPKRKLSDIEKQMIFIMIEKSKLQREATHEILDKGILVFLTFLVLAYLFKTASLVPDLYISILFMLGITVLIVAVISYQSTISKENKILQELLDNFLK